MTKTKSGFTIIELLIVIVVIGILAAITIVAYNGIQGRARDNDRVTDMNSLKKALALFYVDKGYYPAVNDMTNLAFRRDTLKIPEGIVNPPGTVNSVAYCWASSPGVYCYVGVAAPGGSFDCGTAGEQCIGYRISYRLEKDPNTMIEMNN